MLPWAPYEPAARAAKTNFRKSARDFCDSEIRGAYQDNSRCENRPFAGEAVGSVAEDDDADNFTDEDERSDVALSIAVCVFILVKLLENGVH